MFDAEFKTIKRIYMISQSPVTVHIDDAMVNDNHNSYAIMRTPMHHIPNPDANVLDMSGETLVDNVRILHPYHDFYAYNLQLQV